MISVINKIYIYKFCKLFNSEFLIENNKLIFKNKKSKKEFLQIDLFSSSFFFTKKFYHSFINLFKKLRKDYPSKLLYIFLNTTQKEINYTSQSQIKGKETLDTLKRNVNIEFDYSYIYNDSKYKEKIKKILNKFYNLKIKIKIYEQVVNFPTTFTLELNDILPADSLKLF